MVKLSGLRYAAVAELADAHGSGPCEATRVGSNPTRGTVLILINSKTYSYYYG